MVQGSKVSSKGACKEMGRESQSGTMQCPLHLREDCKVMKFREGQAAENQQKIWIICFLKMWGKKKRKKKARRSCAGDGIQDCDEM